MPVFTTSLHRQKAIEIAKVIEYQLDMIIPAFCVMPDHIHVIIYNPGTKKISVSEFVRRFKSRLYHEFRDILHEKESFWQRFYYDHIIRNDKDFAEKFQYVLTNPVKAGLTAQDADPDYIHVNVEMIGLI